MPSAVQSKLWLISISLAVLVSCKPAAIPEQAAQLGSVETVTPAAEASPPAAISNPAAVNYQGFGPAKFGDNQESIRMAWGHALHADVPAKGSSCVYLRAEHLPNQKYGIDFMFEEAKFVRYDVDNVSQIAPGNIKVGDSAEQILQAHAGRVESAPHKYVAGARLLTVTPKDNSAARLIFEIDANGKVISWRIGLPPQVFYVEGCS